LSSRTSEHGIHGATSWCVLSIIDQTVPQSPSSLVYSHVTNLNESNFPFSFFLLLAILYLSPLSFIFLIFLLSKSDCDVKPDYFVELESSTERARTNTQTMLGRGSTALETMRCSAMRHERPGSCDAEMPLGCVAACSASAVVWHNTHLALETPKSLWESNQRRNWKRGSISSDLQPTTTLKSRSFPELWRRIFHELFSASSNDDDTILRSSSSHATTKLQQLKASIDATIRHGEHHVTITNQLRRVNINLSNRKEVILSSV